MGGPRALTRALAATSVSLALALGPGCGGETSVGSEGSAGDESGGSEAADESGGSFECEAGEEQACACPDGGEGVQICDPATGEFGECSGCPPPAVCGDDVCESELGEDCSSCPEDCGTCLDCEEAPTCEQAAVPGPIDVHLEQLDVLPEDEMMPLEPGELALDLAAKVEAGDTGVRVVAAALDPVARPDEHPFVPALREVFARHPEAAAALRRQLGLAGLADVAGYRARFPEPRGPAAHGGADSLTRPPSAAPEDCEDPKLRVRVARVVVHDEADLVFKDIIYCAVIAEATAGAEIRVTPKTFALDNGEEYTYALSEGVVWGQLGEPVAPMGNLAMTYNCLEGDDTGSFEEFLDAIADAAQEAGALPGTYGWIVPVIGLAADIIGAALALEQDDHLFNASQIIPADLQLEMTNGVWWSVQRTGTFMLKDWHWELRLEAWGCTDDAVP